MASAVIDRPGAKAEVKFVRLSARKARAVLGLVRGKPVAKAIDELYLSDRGAAHEVGKVLRSAIANAAHNEDIPEEELFVAECYADEGPSFSRFKARARGRAGRIEKKTCHITVHVARYSDDEIDAFESSAASSAKSSPKKAKSTSRADRVAKSKAKEESKPAEAELEEDLTTDEVETEETDVAESQEPPTPPEDAKVDEDADASTDQESENSGDTDKDPESSSGGAE